MAANTAKTVEHPSMPLADDVSLAASQISAMVDEELERREIDLALRRLTRDDAARDRWERYHLISDVLQGHGPVSLHPGFAGRIRQALETEPTPSAAAKPLPAWYKPVSGFALAASVAMLALYGLKPNQTADLAPGAPLAATSSAAALARPTVAILRPANFSGEPRQARLKNYLVNHNGYASLNGVPGMLPYARLVDYQTDR